MSSSLLLGMSDRRLSVPLVSLSNYILTTLACFRNRTTFSKKKPPANGCQLSFSTFKSEKYIGG